MTSQKTRFLKNNVSLKKKSNLLLLLCRYQLCFILNWLLQEFQERKKSPPPLSLAQHLLPVSQVYKQVHSKILFPKFSMEKQQKKGICTQLHHKSYLIYNQLFLILFVSALPCIWTLTTRCLLNNLNFHLLKPLLWRTTHTNLSYS